jgi:hypothetical protein
MSNLNQNYKSILNPEVQLRYRSWLTPEERQALLDVGQMVIVAAALIAIGVFVALGICR